MAFFKIEDGVVVQKQPNEEDGFIQADDNISVGFLYDGEVFSEPPIPAGSWDDIRNKRDYLLSQSDWTQMSDSPLFQNEDWLNYRQSLRDITEAESPDLIVWPDSP